jgi:8-oxo-dGTP diphosphatase
VAAAGVQPGEVYRNPALTVDGVVLCRRPGDAPLVLLVRRGGEPFRGRHALPGGFVEYGEDPDRAIARELAEETGLDGLAFRQFRAFGSPGRDPRGHTVSLVYTAVLDGPPPAATAGDDAAAADWHSADALPTLAFDHADILAQVLADPATG